MTWNLNLSIKHKLEIIHLKGDLTCSERGNKWKEGKAIYIWNYNFFIIILIIDHKFVKNPLGQTIGLSPAMWYKAIISFMNSTYVQ